MSTVGISTAAENVEEEGILSFTKIHTLESVSMERINTAAENVEEMGIS